MFRSPQLSKGQILYIASGIKTFSEGILLGSSGAFFLPETFQLREPILLSRYMFLFSAGLILFVIGVIIEKRGEK